MAQGATPNHAGDKHRFLLELWLEPLELATRILRLRGRMHNLTTDSHRAVARIADVDSFIHDAFRIEGDEQIRWEGEP